MPVLHELRCDHCDQRIWEKDTCYVIDKVIFNGLEVSGSTASADYDYQPETLALTAACFQELFASFFVPVTAAPIKKAAPTKKVPK